MNSNSRKSATRVLLVDDHQGFRKFIGSVLDRQPDLQLVGEAEEGPIAVRKYIELQPDLVLLDIGLPGLNGFQVARHIRQFDPACRIVFLTQENCPEIVQEALALGAAAYVIKAQTASDLIPAMLAARDGRQFVSSRVEGYNPTLRNKNLSSSTRSASTATISPLRTPARDHYVRFYRDDLSIASGYAGFILDALKAGKGVLSVVTPGHREQILASLQVNGVDAGAAIQAGRFILADVFELMEQVMVNDRLDLDRLSQSAVTIVEGLKNANPGARICACGELAPSLLALGNHYAAMQAEQLWDEVSWRYDLEIFCGYVLDDSRLTQDAPIYQQICAEHAFVAVH